MQHSSSSSGRSVHHRPVHCFYQWIAQSDQLGILLALLSIKLDAKLIPIISLFDKLPTATQCSLLKNNCLNLM